MPEELFEFELDIWAHEDPMDKATFDETRAFPTVKPDIDVLGIPHRSRKQRGWYHVHRRHSGREVQNNSVVGVQPNFRVHASGAEIPEELIEIIVKDLHISTVNSRGEESLNMRAVGRYSLVCRYWANIFQRVLFRVVGLTSEKDVMQLLQYLRQPRSRIQEYIFGFHVPPQAITGRPWIHLLLYLYPCLPSTPVIALNMRGSNEKSGAYSVRSVHGTLPKAPPSYSANFREVTLYDIHFRRFEHLLHLVREMRG